MPANGTRAGEALNQPVSLKPLVVEAADAARLCGVSRTSWYSLRAAGKIPRPVRLGRRVLWRVAELEDWVKEGCPAMHRWEQIKKDRRI
jgi:predicted DNA-binding transcriptional regulator AlpA